MRILLSNHSNFDSSPWFMDIEKGAQYLYLPFEPEGSGALTARYFRLENVPSSYEIELMWGSSLDPEHYLNRVVLRTTNFNTNTGVIDYTSAKIHPDRVIAPGVIKITGHQNSMNESSGFNKMIIR